MIQSAMVTAALLTYPTRTGQKALSVRLTSRCGDRVCHGFCRLWHDRGGVDYSCGAVCLELLAGALVASTASTGALSLAVGVSAESTMTSALPASAVGVRSRSSIASNLGSFFAACS